MKTQKFTEDEEYGVLFKTKFDNKEVKCKITIKKIGETYIIKDNKTEYITKNLSDITFDYMLVKIFIQLMKY